MKKLLLILLPVLMVMSCDLSKEEIKSIDSQLIGTWTKIDNQITVDDQPFEHKVIFGNNTFEITQPMIIHKGSIVPGSVENTVVLTTTDILSQSGVWVPITAFPADSLESMKEAGFIYENFTITYEVTDTTVTLLFDVDDTLVLTKQ